MYSQSTSSSGGGEWTEWELACWASDLHGFGALALKLEVARAQALLTRAGIRLRRPAPSYDAAGNFASLKPAPRNVTGLPRELARAVRTVEEWHDRLARRDAQRWAHNLQFVEAFLELSAAPSAAEPLSADEEIGEPTAAVEPAASPWSLEQVLALHHRGLVAYAARYPARRDPPKSGQVALELATLGALVTTRTSLARIRRPHGLTWTMVVDRLWPDVLAERDSERTGRRVS